jgi:hypothetical protein
MKCGWDKTPIADFWAMAAHSELQAKQTPTVMWFFPKFYEAHVLVDRFWTIAAIATKRGKRAETATRTKSPPKPTIFYPRSSSWHTILSALHVPHKHHQRHYHTG